MQCKGVAQGHALPGSFAGADTSSMCCAAGITALSLLITPFLLQACRHILQEGSSVDSLSVLPSVSLPVSQQPLPCITCCVFLCSLSRLAAVILSVDSASILGSPASARYTGCGLASNATVIHTYSAVCEESP